MKINYKPKQMKTIIFVVFFTLVALCYGVDSTHHIEWYDATEWMDKFPCKVQYKTLWVSQKYITQKKVLGDWKLRRHFHKDPVPIL